MRFGTVDVVWLDPAGSELRLLNSKRCPLVFGHQFDVESLLGVIESAWIEGSNLLVVARFASTRAAQDALTLVRDGVLTNASIGLHLRVDDEPGGTGAKRAWWWRPYECSLAVIPRNWDARILGVQIPLRVRALLADAVAEAAGGSPSTWRAWAASAAAPLAAEIGLDPAKFESLLTSAVESELRRQADEAARSMLGVTEILSTRRAARAA
jgi:hypothetical protein